MANASTYRLQIVVMAAGRHLFATARVGGITVTGRMMGDPASAIRELFRELAAPAQNQAALMAVELMAAGDDYADMSASVEDVLAGSGRGHDRPLLPPRRVPTAALGDPNDPRDWAAREALRTPDDQQDGQGQPGQHE